MFIQPSDPDLRYERKFIFRDIHLTDLIEKVKHNPFCFSEIFQNRRVNNIYFDDYNLKFFYQNVAGLADRLKYRLRWYGQDYANIVHPALEIKRRKGELGDKKRHLFENLTLNLTTPVSDLKASLQANLSDQHILKIVIDQLEPSLFNTYQRVYFLSFCKRFRITLDYDQKFANPYFLNHETATIETEIILELKYPQECDREAREIMQYFNPRLSRHSKYVRGIQRIYQLQIW